MLCRDVLQRPLPPPLCSPCFLEPLSHPRSLASLSVITKAWRKRSGQAGERSSQASCLGLTLKHACCPRPFPLPCVPMPQCTAQSLDPPAVPFCRLQPDTCTEHQLNTRDCTLNPGCMLGVNPQLADIPPARPSSSAFPFRAPSGPQPPGFTSHSFLPSCHSSRKVTGKEDFVIYLSEF